MIGRGASGEVWRGIDREDRVLAFKLLHSDLAGDPRIVERFVQERGLLASIRHPHVVRVHDLVVEGQTLAIVMDLVDGPNLREFLRRHGALPPQQVAQLGAQLAEGLHAAHRLGVIHRDIKPENVLLDTSLTPAKAKLTDFGIAKLVGDSRRSTMLLGTPQYMAPEIAEGADPAPAADLYSLGVTLYELACGITPFAGRGSAMAVLRAQAAEVPGRPDGIPDRLWELIEWMMAKSPAGRPGSASGIAERLNDAASHLHGIPAIPALTVPPRTTTASNDTAAHSSVAETSTTAPPESHDRAQRPTVASPRSHRAGTTLEPSASRTKTRSETPPARRKGNTAKRALILSALAIMLVLTAGIAWAASRQTSPSSTAASAPSTTPTVAATLAPGNAGIQTPEAPTPVTVTRTETKTATISPPATPTDPKYLSSGYQCPRTPSTWSYDPTNQQLTLRTQLALRDLGYTLPANGVYDTATREAVTRFQRNHGLVADGEAGSQTWDCLNAANAINQGTRIP